MATDSYPARGTGGFTIGEWASMHASQDGIINDFMTNGKRACSITVDNASNLVTISPGQVSVDGYVLDIISDTTLSCPAVGSGTVTYTIVAQYDPALNVADGGGAASALGPCRLQIFNTTPPTAGGEKYVSLFVGGRTVGQTLSSVSWADHRRWIGPVFSGPNSSQIAGLNATASRGSVLIQTDSSGVDDQVDISIRTANAANTALVWQNLLRPAAVAWPLAGGLVANTVDSPPQYYRNGPMLHMRGTLKRSNGNKLGTDSDVLLGTMPAGQRPLHTELFAPSSGGNPNTVARLQIAGNGQVHLLRGGDQPLIDWISLSGIFYRAEQ